MILQFGTSRFLQAHVDLFAWQARESGQTVPDITIVQASGDQERARRLPAFANPAGFPVIIRGVEDGRVRDQSIMVRSVVAGLAARHDWHALCDLFVGPVTHVISNTGDSGFDVAASDRRPPDAGAPPVSFCGMLAALLRLRWAAGRPGITVLPCELRSGNGSALRHIVSALVNDQGGEPDFLAWLGSECLWADTLVDRIVSEAIEPAGAIAEPYALWAIQGQPGLALPFTHPSIVVTDDLEPYERLKLHILNLGHSWLAEGWRKWGGPIGMTVREAIADPHLGSSLKSVYQTEVIPGFETRGMAGEAARYVTTTLERFENPFLAHRLQDIFQHHRMKVDRRVGDFIRWVEETGGDIALPQLRALARDTEITQ